MEVTIILRAIVYGLVLLLLGILMIKARRESEFSQKPVAPVLVPVRRAAVWLYKRALRWRARRHGSRGRDLLLSEQARSDLTTLDASEGVGRTMLTYVIDKVMIMLLCLLVGAVLGLLLLWQGQRSPVLTGRSIARPSYGEGDQTVRLEGAAGEETVEYDVTISERQYTTNETDALFEALTAALPAAITGENADLQHVTQDLTLPSSIAGYPFRLYYTSSNYAILHDNGRLYNDDLEEGDAVEVTISVRATYEGRTYRTQIPVTVLPRTRTEQELFADAVADALADADAETIHGGTLYLPQEVGGAAMEWSEPSGDQSLALFVLILFAGGVGCYIKDRQLREQVERRERQMTIDYPQVVSKVTLFLGAGMSVRNIFYKLGEDELRAREEGREAHEIYEEIRLMCRELDSGTSEITAYRNLASRCRLRPYTRLVSLLVQNLQKGNSALLAALEEEAAAAFEERKNIARQMGEEAGTKMLLPMMLMLIITLVIIVVPAYLGFS